jgi:hypothetical protein
LSPSPMQLQGHMSADGEEEGRSFSPHQAAAALGGSPTHRQLLRVNAAAAEQQRSSPLLRHLSFDESTRSRGGAAAVEPTNATLHLYE